MPDNNKFYLDAEINRAKKSGVSVYRPSEMTNEQYRSLPEVSASTLVAIWKDCPAAWRYGDPPSSPALADGIAVHAAILEPILFEETFVCDINPEDHPDALVTAKDMQSWLKDRGIKGASGKTKEELSQMILAAEPDTKILDIMVNDHKEKHEGKTIVKPATWQMISAMREVLFNDAEYRAALTGASVEITLQNPAEGVKCRVDCITSRGEIWDYKTTVSAHPDEFARQAHNNGYWLKMAYQVDQFEKAFGYAPNAVLLAQSKKAPYIPQAYLLTDEQLDVGREQYQQAQRIYKRCQETGRWPAYGGGVQDLPTPQWLARQYGFDVEDDIEIKYVGEE